MIFSNNLHRICAVLGVLVTSLTLCAGNQQFAGYFHIINKGNGQLLSCELLENGSFVLQPTSYHGELDEEWEIISSKDGGYKIINRKYRVVLDLVGGSLSDGADIQVYENAGGTQQSWDITEVDAGRYLIESIASGKALEIQTSGVVYTNRIQQWGTHGEVNQLWSIQGIPESFEGFHYIDNGSIKVGVDADHGGAISWISLSGSDRNVVNTKDYGRYIQQSYYAGSNMNRQDEGQSKHWSPFPWNPLQAGDYFGNPSLVVDIQISEDGDEMYVKTRPRLWDMDGEFAGATMETWISLRQQEIVYTGKLTRYVADDVWGVRESFQELPACYLSSELKNFYGYSGSDLWNFKLNRFPGAEIWESWETHESWVAAVDDSNWGVVVYFPGVSTFVGGYYHIDDDALDSTAYVAPVLDVTLEAFDEYEFRCYLGLGNLGELMNQVYVRRHLNELIQKGEIEE